MNELTITATGWAATDVRLTLGQGGLAIASFRLATTPRFYDRERGQWVDGTTEWFMVRLFRGAALTVEKSITKGQPVVVTGRLRTSRWEAKEGPRTDLIIDATAVGPDCTRGTATFTRATGDPALSEADTTAAAAALAAARESEPSGEVESYELAEGPDEEPAVEDADEHSVETAEALVGH